MSQNKFLKIITAILIVLNVTVISFFLFTRGPQRHRPPHHGPPLFEVIEQKLNFNEQQRDQFKILREDHHSQMVELDKKRDQLLNDYFETLKNQSKEEELNDLMEHIKKTEQQRVEITYDHFNNVKALCREDQLKEFPEVLDISIRHLLQPGKKEGPPPPHKEIR